METEMKTVFNVYYSEGRGTSRYVVFTGPLAECRAYITIWNHSHAIWEVE